jgi:mannose-1-phosphate guanylyltransferase
MKQRPLWAIVLAGGEGTRLAETSCHVYGSVLPKQFLSFGLRRTFLQATLDRLGELVPAQRTVVVVASAREGLAREQLADFEGVELVAQPRNLGTGPGVLLPLLSVLHRDADADVALIPSDHDFRAPHVLLEALLRAQRVAGQQRGMVLLGAAAETPASDLGWIVPRRALGRSGVGIIREFVEKPPQHIAEKLFRRGALWNTMLSVAQGSSLWDLARCSLPVQTAELAQHARALHTPEATVSLQQTYERMPPADFSRDLVARSEGLRVTAMVGAGWSDCGTPERLEAALGKQALALVKTVPRSNGPEAAVVSAV